MGFFFVVFFGGLGVLLGAVGGAIAPLPSRPARLRGLIALGIPSAGAIALAVLGSGAQGVGWFVMAAAIGALIVVSARGTISALRSQRKH